MKMLINHKNSEGVFIVFEPISSIANSKVKINGVIGGSDGSPLVENTKSSANYPPSSPVVPQNVSAKNLEYSYRVQRYYAQNLSAGLLFADSANIYGKGTDIETMNARKKHHRTITCMRSKLSDVKIHKSVEHGKSFYSGLLVCGSVWVCPVCAAKIQARRTIEVQNLFQWVYKVQKKQIAMVTLTFPHGLGDGLVENLAKQKKALEIFRSWNNTMAKSGFKKFKINMEFEGLVRALELTYGANGWHLHTHELWIIKYFEENPELESEIKQYLLDRWELACIKAGLLDATNEKQVKHFRERSVHIVFRAKDSDYIAKQNGDNDKAWGADKEVAQSHSKLGKSSGKSPFQLLIESEETPRYRKLFLEYAYAMKGKAQMFWSPGLKAKVGVEEKTDEELVEEQEDTADLLAVLNREHWVCVVKNKARAELLDIAEQSGIDGLIRWFADFGLVLDRPSAVDLFEDELQQHKRAEAKKVKLAKRNKRKGVKTDEE